MRKGLTVSFSTNIWRIKDICKLKLFSFLYHSCWFVYLDGPEWTDLSKCTLFKIIIWKAHMLWLSIRIASANKSPKHIILWRTSGNYATNSFYSGLLYRFHGYGGADVMRSGFHQTILPRHHYAICESQKNITLGGICLSIHFRIVNISFSS